MSNPFNLQVGQKLFYVPSSSGSPRKTVYWLTIAKVGRKWVEFEEGYPHVRMSLETLRADSNACGYPGTFYLSEEEYQLKLDTQKAWRVLAKHFNDRFTPPSGVTLETIQKCADVLGISLTEEQR